MTTQPREYIADHQSRFQADFFELLRIPSISTDPEHAGSVRAAAEWLRGRMAAAGLRASVEETEGHPLVLGRYDAGPEAPTLLVYAHYDVQPPDPLDAWSSPPFEPTVRDGMVVARGAADDKAQAIIQMGAAEAALATGGLPVNLILLFEGEEEVGSPSLVPYLREHADHLRADHVIIGDSMMFAPGRPSLIFGMRGLAYFEVEIRTGGWDLHSGQYGGAVPNPAHVLAEVIASFHDREGRVAVAGFYDAVAEVPDAWREGWRHLGFDDEAYRRTAGGAPLFGEPGYATHERLWIRPALTVNGMISGYTGPGKKTVLPCRAAAKVSCRLVPDQDPEEIAALFERHVRERVPSGIDVAVTTYQANPPWRADPDAPLFAAAGRALEEAFGTPPVKVAHGGTLPIAREFAETLGAQVAVMGFALPGANMHGPDEWFPLAHLRGGMEAMVALYRELAR